MREIRDEKDECWPVYRKLDVSTDFPEETWQCKVRAPGGTSPYTTNTTYCLNVANGSCTNYQDAQPVDMCNGSNSDTAVKSVVSRTYTPATTSAKGSMLSVYKMCKLIEKALKH